jgi:hypothetical protein
MGARRDRSWVHETRFGVWFPARGIPERFDTPFLLRRGSETHAECPIGWTTLHLTHEEQVAEILGIPYAEFTQVALVPVAYTKGTSFRPAPRRSLDTVLHVDAW